MRAYVACLEAYSDSLRADFGLISDLYGRQLMLPCYRVNSPAELAPVREELGQTLERLARVHPEGAYALIHAFDHAFDRSSMGLRPALRKLFAAASDVVHACANRLAAGRHN